jgi:hypothetical protein
LIVVENGGKFGIEALLARKGTWLFPEYFYHPHGNKSGALNSVLQELGDCLVVFFDDDIRVDAEILCHYSRAAGEARTGTFFGGAVLVDYERMPPAWLLNHLPVSARGWQPASAAYAGVVGRLAFLGCNWAAFAADLKAVGGFDRRVGPGGTSGGTGQERAMQIVLCDAGIAPHYLSNAVVWHYVPRSRCSVGWSLQRAYRNAIRVGLESDSWDEGPTIAGLPRHLIARAMHEGVAVLRHCLRDSPERRYRRVAALLGTIGNMRGARRRRAQAAR